MNQERQPQIQNQESSRVEHQRFYLAVGIAIAVGYPRLFQTQRT
ncbi:MAG: hypothetical protein UV58_C0020G0002 [Candidatus Wolfebacteria bacterium GW2011_GWC1_43_10]|uniref:Uncharacterized protein n=1 Tax=Candidatus Wolfebacteria bacterium GW2011_GWC1_43_10 TaxID=1619011 RepID=A0A0G1C768_9BACT|nr:MAG: hypothetical protein UV58_C0020G0002 [Candidatus Wolfebacteria bacterium GW2011_GWC1_43_10]